MRFQAPISGSGHGGLPVKGFTLPEILIATTVFLLMVGGIIAANLFGMRMFQVTQTKLNAIRWARQTVEAMTAEVRACNSVEVGNVTTNGVFEGLLNGETQQGNALMIYPTTSNNIYTMYNVEPADQTFRQTVATPFATNTVIMADSVTNPIAFTAQNFSGNVLTNDWNNRVIHLTLEFYQPARFLVGADYYKIETSMTRRALQ